MPLGDSSSEVQGSVALELLRKVEKPAVHSVVLPAAVKDQIEASKLAAIYKLMEEILQPGIDYDLIKGTEKPTLLKPDAELLAQTFSLTEKYSVLLQVEELDRTPPFIRRWVQCDLYQRETGNHVGQGVGAANPYEDKHRWRWQGKGDERRRVENMETRTLGNTLLKMAKKRAFVDAVLTFTGASRLFTQDLEDLGLNQDEDDRKASPNQLEFLRKMGAAKTYPPFWCQTTQRTPFALRSQSGTIPGMKYHRMTGRGKPKQVAIVAVAREDQYANIRLIHRRKHKHPHLARCPVYPTHK